MNILVIGGGPGGYVAAIRAAQLGASVTLVEKDKMGGTCLNVGCIPTKALLHSAELYEMAKNGAAVGVIAEPKLDFSKVQSNKADVTSRLVKGVMGLMKANKITVLEGVARFADKRRVEIQSKEGVETITPDKIIIATGSVPAAPPIPGLDGPKCIDSTGALSLSDIPKSMVIIGGGVIGVELATAYRAFGSEITIVEMLPEILPMFDPELVAVVKGGLVASGVKILTSAKVLSVEDGNETASVKIETSNGIQTAEGERILVSIGRRADTDGLLLDRAGISAERGRILVNSRMETNVSGIYAIGDCLGKTMLAHVASAQGEVAAENAMGHSAEYNEKTNPSCVYTNPELASVGITEAEARARGIKVAVGRFPLAANGKALIENGGVGMVKIIAGEKYNEILGVGIAGARATDLIAQASLAIGLEATADEVISTIYAHPTVSEAVREAALAVQKRAVHMVN